jgi:peptidoglycan/LPS O-acetylase OafA/YrhL
MKYNYPLLMLWSVGVIQLTFVLMLAYFDSGLTNTIYYKSSLFMNGFMFGMIAEYWARN